MYVTTGGLKYQVQVSRKLNPYDVEDREYFTGLPDAASQVTQQDQWYGVFLRVENRSNANGAKGKTIRSARTFTMVDTTGKTVKSTPLPASNVFAYRAQPIAAGGHTPEASSAAATGSIGGSLVLFKVTQEMLDNRPTQLHIMPVDGSEEATVDLDI
jgi:hypothetical protein